MKKTVVLFTLVLSLAGITAEARYFDASFLDTIQYANVHQAHKVDTTESQKLLDLSSENPNVWSISSSVEVETSEDLISRLFESSENPDFSPRKKFVSETTIRKTYEEPKVVPATFRPEPYFDMVNRDSFEEKDLALVKERNKRAMVKALRYRMVFETR